MDLSSDRTSSSATSRDRIVDLDHELNGGRGDSRGQRDFVHVWRIPMPVRQGRMVSDSVKIFAILMTAMCIAQAVYLWYLRSAFARLENDLYDNIFWETEWHSPSVWENIRQEFLHGAKPVPVHSHNDYWRSIPVHEALASGCISIEADVHLASGDLYVGHSGAGDKSQTLRAMYLQPLQRMLESQNADITDGQWRGIFNQSPQQAVVLLIDIKTAGAPAFTELNSQLQPLRELDYLTYWNGTSRIMRPLIIIASGNAPFASIKALDPTHRDIFWDARLDQLLSIDDDFNSNPPRYGYNISNSYYASARFRNAQLYPVWHNDTEWKPSTPLEKDITLSQIGQAKERGLISRYWDTPTHPQNLRDIVWRVLVDLEVGVLNMDDMGAVRARARGWGNLQ